MRCLSLRICRGIVRFLRLWYASGRPNGNIHFVNGVCAHKSLANARESNQMCKECGPGGEPAARSKGKCTPLLRAAGSLRFLLSRKYCGSYQAHCESVKLISK